MTEAGVEERSREDPDEPVAVARLDAVAIEPVVGERVDDLAHPHERGDRHHELQPGYPDVAA